MKERTALAIAVVVGFLISSPILVAQIHKSPVGWGFDPWMWLGILVALPGIRVGVALSPNNHGLMIGITVLTCWFIYGSICYVILLPFRRRA